MPDYPIVDAHVHLWDPDRFPMPWLDALEPLNRPMGLAAYDDARGDTEVDAIVYLQVEVAPAYGLLEAREIVRLSVADSRIKGIVAWAPLEDGTRSRSYLDALTELGDRIKGVRRLTQDEPDPSFCLSDGFIAGARLLAEYGLSCDLCCNFRQLGETVELVRRVPETMFVLDHIGKPDIRVGAREPWMSQIEAMAALPNISCKISGVVTEADHDAWEYDQIAPYLEHVLSRFGEDRVFFGSDWPVSTLAARFQQWIEVVDRVMAGTTDEQRRKLWVDNATRFYRLDDSNAARQS